MQYICHYKSPLGGITMASDGNALTGLWFDGQKYFAEGLAETAAAKAMPAGWIFILAAAGRILRRR